MASIRKRGNSYQITVSNGRRADGSQIIETDTFIPEPGMTARQIERALNEFVVDFERDVKAGQNVKGRRMTLKQLADLFLEDTRPADNEEEGALSFTTWISYRDTLRLRIIPRLGHLRISSVIPKTLKDYSRELRQDGARQDGKPGGLSESTIRRDCRVISSMLSYAAGEGLLPVNPILYAGKQRKTKKPSKEYKVNYLTIEQTKAFLWVLDNRILIRHKAHQRIDDTGLPYSVPEYNKIWKLSLMWRTYFYVALFVGDRRGENLSLTWEDIDLKTGAVNISKSTVYADRKIIHKSTKTNKSRTPILPPVVTSILKQWRTEQLHLCLERGSYWEGYRGKDFDKNYLFTRDNGLQVHPSTPYHKFKTIIRIYNENVAEDETHMLPASATQHDLRHTAASILIANHMDPRSVAGILGHANPTTTLNIYSYFFQSKNEEAAGIMENTLIGQK